MSGGLDRRTVISGAVALVVLVAIVLGGIALAGGGNGEEATTSPAPAEAPSGGTTPPSADGLQLPPGIAECVADQGFDVAPSELHSVPPQVLNECFQALHQGDGAP
jgi:hypothetical protein